MLNEYAILKALFDGFPGNEKGILVQDVRYDSEVDRFENLVYRRGHSVGDSPPLFFAPYFTQDSKKPEGIGGIAKILGTHETENVSWKKVENKCQMFLQSAYPDDEDKWKMILPKWQKGVGNEHEKDKVLTYYFLGEPVLLQNSILKKDWLPSRIPANHRVTFADFLKNSGLVK